jgi:transmembrane sensor
MNKLDYQNFEDFILDETFREYVMGSPESSVTFWNNWITEHPEKANEFRKAVNILRTLLHTRKIDININKHESLVELLTKMEESQKKPVRQRFLLPAWIRVAAIIIFSIGLAWLWNWSYGIFKGNETIAYNEVIVPVGEKSQVLLSDGTHVWINSGSRFKYPVRFGKQSRDVYLSGEAFFDVTHHEKQTFVVNTSDARIKVLGTAFNVKAYPEDLKTQTTVVRGLVSVQNIRSKGETVLIRPTQMAVIKKEAALENMHSGNSLPILKVVNRINVEAVTCWKDQLLVFADEPFEEMAMKMDRWFSVHIIIEDNKLKKERYNGKFVHNETIYQVLEAIKVTTPIRYIVKNNEIRIVRK